jgi:hypothetical protein
LQKAASDVLTSRSSRWYPTKPGPAECGRGCSQVPMGPATKTNASRPAVSHVASLKVDEGPENGPSPLEGRLAAESAYASRRASRKRLGRERIERHGARSSFSATDDRRLDPPASAGRRRPRPSRRIRRREVRIVKCRPPRFVFSCIPVSSTPWIQGTRKRADGKRAIQTGTHETRVFEDRRVGSRSR